MNALPFQQSVEFNIAPVMKMYLDSIEAWKKNYEALTMNARNVPAPNYAAAEKKAFEPELNDWQKSGGDIFRRFVEQQIELCRFFAGRWEHYLKLQDLLAKCQTPAEFGQVQAAFLSEFASDYMQEAGKLARPMGELMSHWAEVRRA